jgi:hypothetical protein
MFYAQRMAMNHVVLCLASGCESLCAIESQYL